MRPKLGKGHLELGIVMSPTVQSTTFSDNVAASFPLKRMNIPGMIGNNPHTFYVEPSRFFEHLLSQIIIAVWDGLKIGVIFRGAITVGRLVHDDKIIAGEALIKAVELEKATKWPRIEIAPEVINLVDDHGQSIINEDIKEECLEQIEGRWFVRTLGFHMGYWHEHKSYRQQQGKSPEEIPVVLSRIRECLDNELEKVRENGSETVKEKWKWFISEFENAFKSGNWNKVQGAYAAACRIHL